MPHELNPQPRPSPHFITIDKLSESALEGLFTKDITQYLKITKLTIQKYLEACITEGGQFRKFFEEFATFTGDYLVNENLSKDPNARHLQIARFFRGVQERPPQIFIQDSGYSYIPSSLGGFSAGWNLGRFLGDQVVRITDVINIPIEITAAAMDEQQIEDLQAFLSAAFGQFQHFTTKYILKPSRGEAAGRNAGAYWEVRIPLRHEMSAKRHSPLHGDPKDRFWEATMSMEIEFENSTFIHYRAGPQFQQTRGSLVIVAPDKVPLNRPTQVDFRDLAFPVKIYSDNSRVALIEQTGTQFTIFPKRLGKFNIIAQKPGATETDAPIIKTKEVEVIPR